MFKNFPYDHACEPSDGAPAFGGGTFVTLTHKHPHQQILNPSLKI